MYSKQEENLILYPKSKHKITIHLILYFFVLCVYFLAMAYLFSSMEFLKVDDPAFRSMLIKLGIGQILLYGITFLLLSTGKKWFRILYWINIKSLLFPDCIPGDIWFVLQSKTNNRFVGFCRYYLESPMIPMKKQADIYIEVYCNDQHYL